MCNKDPVDEILKVAQGFLSELERYIDIQALNAIEDFCIGDKASAERSRIIKKIVARVK